MTMRESTFTVRADPANPGQFLACCGLLELAHRLWKNAEGFFDEEQSRFTILVEGDATLDQLLESVISCPISGLTAEEQEERDRLEKEKQALRKLREKLSAADEQRRSDLGTAARKGALQLGAPFHLTLDWWQTDDADPSAPKTWAGLQEIHKIARAAQDALSEIQDRKQLFEHACVLRKPREYWKKSADQKDAVAPFYFDSRRFAHALDAGWSLDVQNSECLAHPAVELLSLIGIQRFRPRPAAEKRVFEYWLWSKPLNVPVAAAVAGGAIPIAGRSGFRFVLKFRDDQKRLKAFGYANPIGGES